MTEKPNEQIRIAEHCGLCFGAEKSIETALAALRDAEESGRPVVLHKELLHNATVMTELQNKGAVRVDAIDEIPDNALVVVRAHGEGEAFYEKMRSLPAELRDATCANVKKIHGLVRRARAAGKAIVIFGKRGHAETEGVNGWCGNAAAVLEREADVETMPAPPAAEILAVCQTTMSRETAERLLALLRRRFPEKTVEFKDTVCSAPLRIREPSMRLAEDCDILFTIGGEKSSNTAELRKQCERAGAAECPPQMDSCRRFAAYLKTNADKITGDKRYGFTAGASTPREEVEKCRDLLAFWLCRAETKNRLERKMADVNKTFADSDNRLLREAAGHFAAINGGGKYVRGVLANIGCRIAAKNRMEKDPEEADALSLAFELFQTAVLVHDDLIDHATTRRGKKTITRRYLDAYAAAGTANETANAMAVCIGDWGMFKAVELLTSRYGAHPRFAELVRVFTRMIIRTIQGEIIDTALPFEQRTGISRERGESLVAAIREIHHKKTSWYTTIAPLDCGMILGGGGKNERETLREFADRLGIAFQIRDDILGVFGSAAETGKDICSDVSEYKQTLLYAFTEMRSPALFRELQTCYGRENLTESDCACVREIFTESGARAEAEAEMTRHFDRAREILDAAPFLSPADKSLLRGLILHLALREN